MKSVSAYRAEDGSLHETREAAARADLIAIGFDSKAAAQIIERRSELELIFQQVAGYGYIPAYFPEAPPSPVVLAAE